MSLWEALGMAIVLGALLTMQEVEIQSLKKQVATMERRTAPLEKVCSADDFYETFFRLVQEECDKK